MWPVEFFTNELTEFGIFLNEKNVLMTSIGFILALQVNSFFLDVIDDIIKPVANRVIAEDINKHTVNVYGIKLKIGHLFFSVFNLIITLIMIFYIYRLSIGSPSIVSTVVSSIQNSVQSVLSVFK
jgi:large-conductance mechanosensitive channel